MPRSFGRAQAVSFGCRRKNWTEAWQPMRTDPRLYRHRLFLKSDCSLLLGGQQSTIPVSVGGGLTESRGPLPLRGDGQTANILRGWYMPSAGSDQLSAIVGKQSVLCQHRHRIFTCRFMSLPLSVAAHARLGHCNTCCAVATQPAMPSPPSPHAKNAFGLLRRRDLPPDVAGDLHDAAHEFGIPRLS